MMRVLFICGRGRSRSPTAAQIALQWEGVRTDCAGLSRDADDLLSSEQLAWADMIFVMDRRQRARLSAQFGQFLGGKRIICLDVQDCYSFMEPELVELLTAKLRPHLAISSRKGDRA